MGENLSLHINHLFNTPEHLSTVAGWIYHEFWQDKPGYSPAIFEALLRDADDPGRIPLSLLALIDDRPAGTVNLIHNDDPTRPHLHPWLAALVVVPQYRGQGVGSALVRALLQEARRLDVSELYLGTDIPGFYERCGAVIHEHPGEDHWIMRFVIEAESPVAPGS